MTMTPTPHAAPLDRPRAGSSLTTAPGPTQRPSHLHPAGPRSENYPGPGMMSRAVEDLLAGRSEVTRDALGFDLGLWHACVIVWGDDGSAADPARLEPVLDAIAHAAGATRSLILPGTSGETWMWMRWTRRPDRGYGDAMRESCPPAPGIRAVIGPVALGVRGFQDTWRSARSVAHLIAGTPADPYSPWLRTYAEVAGVAMLCADRSEAAHLIGETLGDLGREDERSTELRETLRLYLAYGRSRRRTAEHLHIGRSTVAYRVDRAVTLLGHPISEDTLAVRLALEVAHYTGLGAPSHTSAPDHQQAVASGA
jgi:PucR C-terminal helix-turn-helix domain/GGDEF-like domain